MEILTNIKNAINNFVASSIKSTEERQKRELAAREARLKKKIATDGDEMIQVKEFGGSLYFAFDGVPLVRTNLLKEDITDAIKHSREDYLAFMLKESKK